MPVLALFSFFMAIYVYYKNSSVIYTDAAADTGPPEKSAAVRLMLQEDLGNF